MSLVPTPDDSDKENLSPGKPQQHEPTNTEKKEQPSSDEFGPDWVKPLLEKESSSDDKIDASQDWLQAAMRLAGVFKEQGSSVININLQSGGLRFDGNLNNSGEVVGGNQTNYSHGGSKRTAAPSRASDEPDYAQIPLPERVEKWFEDHPAIHHRSLMLAMAFLNGSDCKAVIELSEKIEAATRVKLDRLKSDRKSQKLDAETLEFKMLGFRKRLVTVLSRTENSHENTDEIAVFIDSDFQEAVIRHIWREEDYYWQIVLKCFVEISPIYTLQTKLRLAASLSESCKYHFDLVREIVLIPWAESDNLLKHSLAALSLGITGASHFCKNLN